ncbi:hypothetical protein AB3Y40_05275 [Yoonia sp. R2331]|uniref:hypothetical protein n=1 Tax=Yoonia sp. R2331 TaxID=3237238 RepID=UPI0034E43ECF
MLKALSVAAALFLMAAPAQSQGVAVSENFGSHTMNWSKGGAAYMRWKSVEIDGIVHLCGIYANLSNGTRTNRFNQKLMREARITKDGATILRNLSFFSIANRAHVNEELIGQVANCRSTGQTVEQLGGLGGFSISFRQGRYRL